MSGGKIAGIAPQPRLCEHCHPAFIDELERDPQLTVANWHCPHNQTVAMAFLVTLHGERVIGRWVEEGPVRPDQAPDVMARLAAAVAAADPANVRPEGLVQ